MALEHRIRLCWRATGAVLQSRGDPHLTAPCRPSGRRGVISLVSGSILAQCVKLRGVWGAAPSKGWGCGEGQHPGLRCVSCPKKISSAQSPSCARLRASSARTPSPRSTRHGTSLRAVRREQEPVPSSARLLPARLRERHTTALVTP